MAKKSLKLCPRAQYIVKMLAESDRQGHGPTAGTTARKGKYDLLDALLVARIARAPCAFAQLQEDEIMAAAEPFTLPDRYGVKAPTWRVLDRRLQALRKHGRIEFVKAQWCIQGTGRML